MQFLKINLIDRTLDSYFTNYSRAELAKRSVLLAVATSIFLVLIKIVAWLLTDSISMQASVNDSFLDALSSFIAYHALRYSSIKFDDRHNFGHEKIEGVFAIFQCLLIAYSGYITCHETYEFLINPKPIENTSVGIFVMAISCVAVYQLVYFQNYVITKTGSFVIKGDSLHYISDFFMNICVMISIFLSKYFAYVDVVCGLTVGAYVFYSVFLILRSALLDLMDEALPANVRDKIEKAIIEIDGVESVKILKTRSAGMKKYVESRIIVSKRISLEEACGIADAAENAVKRMFDDAEVIIKPEVSQS